MANASGLESAGVAFTVTLSAAATDNVTATWTASIETGDSAETADFGSPLTGTATFTPSQTAVTITVPTIDDSTDEDDDTFTLTLSSPSANATLASDATATGTITDNDDPPTISVEDQTVIEGDQDPDDVLGQGSSIIFPFRVTLSAASEKRVRYKVRRVELASDTATDADLQPSVAFRGIQSIVGVTFRYLEGDVIRDDDLDEPDETFTLEIYDFENATAGAKTQSTITIQDDDEVPVAPTKFTATLGNMEVALAWDAPGPDSGVTGHEYRYKTTGNYLENWTAIADSAVAGANEASFTVTMLTNGTQYTFQLRAVSAAGNGAEAEADPVTPMLGICDRTAKIQEVILAEISGVDNCAAVTDANLAAITSFGTTGSAR